MSGPLDHHSSVGAYQSRCQSPNDCATASKIVAGGQNSVRADETADLKEQGEKCGEVDAAERAQEEPARNQAVRRSRGASKSQRIAEGGVQSITLAIILRRGILP